MNRQSIKDKLQGRISHWVKTIRDVDVELNLTDNTDPDYRRLARVQSEYKGRVYAARYFDDIFGFNFDTDFISIR